MTLTYAKFVGLEEQICVYNLILINHPGSAFHVSLDSSEQCLNAGGWSKLYKDAYTNFWIIIDIFISEKRRSLWKKKSYWILHVRAHESTFNLKSLRNINLFRIKKLNKMNNGKFQVKSDRKSQKSFTYYFYFLAVKRNNA